jgi:hypothetical protein
MERVAASLKLSGGEIQMAGALIATKRPKESG